VRPFRPILVLASAALLAGCGDHNLVVKVDVLSYLDSNLTHFEFGPVPAMPEGFYTGEQTIIKDATVNMVEGTNSIAEIKSVSISISTLAADSTGAGSDTLRLYMSDLNTDPLTTSPVLEMPIDFSPGVSQTLHAEASGDARVADLFSGKQMKVTLTTAARGPQSGDPLNASIRLTALDAVVIGGRKGF
jgi:hypothetical protein